MLQSLERVVPLEIGTKRKDGAPQEFKIDQDAVIAAAIMASPSLKRGAAAAVSHARVSFFDLETETWRSPFIRSDLAPVRSPPLALNP